MRTSRSRPARIIAAAFTEWFRNTPPLVQIFFFYFALPVIGIRLPAVVAGTLALVFYQGAIAIEVLRAGLQAVHSGQDEAASALGLSGLQKFLYVKAPQAFRISLPSLGNNLISFLKNTSLVSAIGVLDITGWAMDIIAIRLSSAELFLAIGVFYLVAVTILSAVLRVLEQRMAKYAP
ncbi:MAG: amino acid ABC transporter permease [Candidatus Eremiobacteraeota bacterium]|nr:amino acid ABC transporter permease [Candidatus Eremiobacteraeota bacterium]